MTILKMSVPASILIIAIIIIRRIMLHRLPKRAFLVLWGVASYRLLISLSIPSQFSLYTLIDEIKRKDFNSVITSGTTLVSDAIEFTKMSEISAINMDYKEIFKVIWIIGMMACAFVILVKHFRSLSDYKASLPIDSNCVRLWERENRMVRKVEIRQSDKISAALTYGLFHPVVLLPKATDWQDEKKLRYILAHEYVHIRRFDIICKWLFTAVVCIHWFNPLVWIMYTLANRDIELSCDEAVVQIFGVAERSSYALTLIKLQEKKSLFNPLTNHFSKNAIEERTVSIMKTKKVTFLSVVAAFAVVMCTVAVFATDSISAIAGENQAAGQMVCSDGGKNVDNSAGIIYPNNISKDISGLSVQEVKNGHMVVYEGGESGWSFTQGETVNLHVDIESVLQDGQTAVIGYVIDDVYTDIYAGKIDGTKDIEFIIPANGEYAFYFIGASSDTIYVQSFEVE